VALVAQLLEHFAIPLPKDVVGLYGHKLRLPFTQTERVSTCIHGYVVRVRTEALGVQVVQVVEGKRSLRSQYVLPRGAQKVSV
jgi:hypothetical protein